MSNIGGFRVVDFGFWVWAFGLAASGLRFGVENIRRELGLITNMGQILLKHFSLTINHDGETILITTYTHYGNLV